MAAVAHPPPEILPPGVPEPAAPISPSSPPPVTKPPQGEELWESVKAAVAKPWVAQQDPTVPSSLVVFDWDDTILPTAALVAARRIAPAPGNPGEAATSGARASAQLSDWDFDSYLEACGVAALQALQQAKKYGRVIIITNSGFGWVHETAVRFLPCLLSELEDIPVISARSIFEPLGVTEPYRWKVLCFRRIVDCFSFDPSGQTGPSSLISIGDGWQERVAAIMAAQDSELGVVKCLKFLEQPGVDQLARELDLCAQVLEGLAGHPGWVEASYSYAEAWGLQLEARAADTSALGGSFAAVQGTVEVVSDTVDNAGEDQEDTAMTEEAVEAQESVAESEPPAPPATSNGRKRVRRGSCRSNKASLLARAGKVQALPLRQQYLTMSVHKKVASSTARRLWFQARKKSCKVRTLKAGNIIKCNGATL